MDNEYRKCPHCSEWILRDAIICRFCGNSVEPTTNRSEKIVDRKKNAWLAAILNAFPLLFGLGYVYLGKWARFIIIVFIQLFSLAPFSVIGLQEYNKYFLAVIWISSMVDAYNLAKGE